MIDCKGNYTIKGYFDPYLSKEVKRFFCLSRSLSQDTHRELNATIGQVEMWLKQRVFINLRLLERHLRSHI